MLSAALLCSFLKATGVRDAAFAPERKSCGLEGLGGVRKGLGWGMRGRGLGEVGAAAKGRLVLRMMHMQRKRSREFEPGWRISKARQVLIFFVFN